MNSKRAKKLRKVAQYEGNNVGALYNEGYDSVWGPLPKIKDSLGQPIRHLVDFKKLKDIINKIPNAKFKGQGFDKEVRYSLGSPTKLVECNKKLYRDLKQQFSAVA